MRDLPRRPAIGPEGVAGEEPELTGLIVGELGAALAAKGAGAARQIARELTVDFECHLPTLTTATHGHACKTHGRAKRSGSGRGRCGCGARSVGGRYKRMPTDF